MKRPEWFSKAVAEARSRILNRGIETTDDDLLNRIIKRELSAQSVANALHEIETELVAERRRERLAEADRLEAKAAAIRREA